MAYWNRPTSVSSPSLDQTALSAKGKQGRTIADEFYEIEPAVVLDVILDATHKYFQSQKYALVPDQWPVNVNGTAAAPTDLDYTWIGRALVRLIYSNMNVEKEELVWAMPLESNISEYPLLNENVGVVHYLGQYYYTRKINTFNTPNADADFNSEIWAGGFRSAQVTNKIIQGNRELLNNPSDTPVPYIGPTSNLSPVGGSIGYAGVLGRYFYYNPRIRSLKRREGDLIFESRFGQSIRLASYDDNRVNDKGYNSTFNGYADYKGNGYKYSNINGTSYEAGGGNPMIIIRNRQKPLGSLTGVDATNAKNVGGYMVEDVNNDGTSIHLTSGVTLSAFQTTCDKVMWGDGSEEQPLFNGQTSFQFPSLTGDQLVINSDRIVLSSKKNETFLFSKKRMSLVTDDEFTIDAQNQIVITTNNKTVLNSPAIYLGEYDETGEPVLLGQTTVNWLYQLCGWMISHTHWYKHTHPDVGQPDNPQTQGSVQVANLVVLRDQLSTLLSRRVYVTGGGFAPGADGGSIPNGVTPVSVNPLSGAGAPGGFSGTNFK
jgi:hypothetical protein